MSEPPPAKLTGAARLVRILEDGWTIFAPHGSNHALIVIDDRKDEPIPCVELSMLVPDTLTTRRGEFRGEPGTFYDLRRGPEAEVTLRFKSESEKDYFMSQLSDGWGENLVRLDWPWRDGVKFQNCRTFNVIVTDDYRPERRGTY
jgi:hypothetical protein